MSTTKIKLDRSKYFSTVVGDRLPDDPHYKVHFWQDDLPFDSQGELVPDDNRTGTWRAKTADQKDVEHTPLWTEKMRGKVEKKLARLNKATVSIEDDEPVNAESEDDARKKAAEEVNIGSFLRGEVNYQKWALFEAVRARYGKRYTSIETLVNELVLDEKVIPEEQLADRYKKHLDIGKAA